MDMLKCQLLVDRENESDKEGERQTEVNLSKIRKKHKARILLGFQFLVSISCS